jgi:hypothetical protein
MIYLVEYVNWFKDNIGETCDLRQIQDGCPAVDGGHNAGRYGMYAGKSYICWSMLHLPEARRPKSCEDFAMAGFFDRIADFFDRHRAHCAIHESYQRDCAACRLANQATSPVDWVDTGSNYYGGDTPVDTSSSDGSLPDTSSDSSSPDASASDNSFSDTSGSDTSGFDTASSDFGGFDGGCSGGGGASGDF